MASALTVLLLGCWLARQSGVSGERNFPKPSLSVSPRGVTELGENVTFQCVGEQPGMRFVLSKNGAYIKIQDPSGREAVFPIPSVGPDDSGRYTCQYHTKSQTTDWSEPSDPVELVVPGESGPLVLTWPIIAGASAAATVLLLFLLVAFICFRKTRARKGAAPRPSSTSPMGALKALAQQDPVYASIDEWKETQTLPQEPDPGADGLTYAELDGQALQAKQGALAPAPEPTQPRMYAMINMSQGAPQPISSPGCWLAGRSGVSGEPSYPKPNIALSPSGGVSLGGSVTVWCRGQHRRMRFVLNKERRHFPPVDSNGFEVVFSISNVSWEHGGNYSCSYHSRSEPFAVSYPSDPAELVLRDPSLPRPSISLSPTGITAPGADVTIRCQGQRRNVTFFLHKAGDLNPQQHMDPAGDGAEFLIPTVGRQHGGSYSCSYRPRSEPFVSSQPSDTVQLVVAAVTVRCWGQRRGMRFVLNKDGRHFQAVDSDRFEAVFSINMSREHSGNYSCSYHSRSEPFAMSYPSDPVELVLRAARPDFTNANIARLALGAVVLLILGLILAEACYSRPRVRPRSLNPAMQGRESPRGTSGFPVGC
ncbi:immunoglobulin superfamily member 1-like [Terrapene carolina triunguis]|uniref:immunoglobulin superfamily member 1-like n=1 Tax=Terrapene triunguis TaxID=2587831 RepID=UPI0011569532|nr:immunoglobulin superfamily member 1-like [Terrapene carolina triunguis]